MTGFKTIKKSSAPELVVDQILQKLKNGELLPGERLPSQRELSEILGVGRSSIREAINALVVMGYLKALQGKGTFVLSKFPSTDLSMRQLNFALKMGTIFTLMEARELLECNSVKLAAKRTDKSNIKILKRTLNKIDSARNEYPKFLEADMEFHSQIAEATENIVICEMTKLVLKKVVEHHLNFETTLLSSAYIKNSILSAKEIVSCIEKGDGETAAKWMKVHLNAIENEINDIVSFT